VSVVEVTILLVLSQGALIKSKKPYWDLACLGPAAVFMDIRLKNFTIWDKLNAATRQNCD
jgi:hypothetical protein